MLQAVEYCISCGEAPPKTPSETKGQKVFYCRDACRQKAYRARKKAARNAQMIRAKTLILSQDSVEVVYTGAVYCGGTGGIRRNCA